MGSEEAAKLANCGGDFDGAMLGVICDAVGVSMVEVSVARRGNLTTRYNLRRQFYWKLQLQLPTAPATQLFAISVCFGIASASEGIRAPTDRSWTLSWALSCRRKPVSPPTEHHTLLMLRGAHSWLESPANDTRNRGRDGVPGFGSDNFTWTPKSGSDNFLPWHPISETGVPP